MARSRRRSRRKEETPGWVWMLAGFTLGIVAAGSIYIYSQLPARPANATPVTTDIDSADAPLTAQPSDRSLDSDAPETFRSGGPQQTVAEETTFDFYEVLPEFEVVVPESAEAQARDIRDAAIERSGSFVVQVGAFRTREDADRRQAEIALLGFESSLQRVAVDDDVYHRVRIGPITELAELNRVRRRLRDERIDYMLIEQRD